MWPDYLIQTSNPEFEEVMNDWFIELSQAWHKHISNQFTYMDKTLDLNLTIYEPEDEETIYEQLSDSFKQFKRRTKGKDLICYLMVGFPKHVKLSMLEDIIYDLQPKVSKRGMRLNAISSYHLTHQLSEDMLDNPMPDLNLVIISEI